MELPYDPAVVLRQTAKLFSRGVVPFTVNCFYVNILVIWFCKVLLGQRVQKISLLFSYNLIWINNYLQVTGLIKKQNSKTTQKTDKYTKYLAFLRQHLKVKVLVTQLGSTLPARLLCRWDFPRNNTGVGCHSLHQGIFPIQGSNPGVPQCRKILYHLSHTVLYSKNLNWT